MPGRIMKEEEPGSPTIDEWDEEQVLVLERAVAKLVRFGEQVGVTAEEMISLLDSGMSVDGLLDYLVSARTRCSGN